jgi:hypothetical protein
LIESKAQYEHIETLARTATECSLVRKDIRHALETIEALRDAHERLWVYATHRPDCWKNVSTQELGVGGPLASCTCGLDDIEDALPDWILE